MRIVFEEELKTLHEQIVVMLSMTEEQIDKTLEALKTQDLALAKDVIDGDDAIDKQEKKIEKQCLEIIVRQSPVAKDMRRVTSIFKLITDLERIADHAEDICTLIVNVYHQKQIKPLVKIPNMAKMARSMVSRVITAYMQNDIELAKEVAADDEGVDEIYHDLKVQVIDVMKANPSCVEEGVALIQIAKHFERIADHATNVAEWIIFNETGKHKSLN